MKLEILFEDNHLLVINKPIGILVQGDKTGDTPLLDHVKKYIKFTYYFLDTEEPFPEQFQNYMPRVEFLDSIKAIPSL